MHGQSIIKIIFITILAVTGCSSSNNFEGHRSPTNFQDCLKSLTELSRTDSRANFVDMFLQIENQLKKMHGIDSLIDIHKTSSAEEVAQHNKNILDTFKKPQESLPEKGFTNYLLGDEDDVLFRALKESNVHRYHACYDPTHKLGFCFGRATIIHMEALIRGVHPRAIKKVWVVGDFNGLDYHVATMVRLGANNWVVFDTNFGKPILARHWFKAMQDLKTPSSKELMYFVTDPNRFSPFTAAPYSSVDLFNTQTLTYDRTLDFYGGYLHDYFEDLAKARRHIKKFPER